MIAIVLMSIGMSLAIIVFHYWALRAITLVSRQFSGHFWMSFTVVSCLFLVHLFEIAWYATHLFVVNQSLGFEGFAKSFEPLWRDYFHIAASGYSTLGMISPAPVGNLAISTDFIALTGFMMLTWSATYYYNIFSNSHAPSDKGTD